MKPRALFRAVSLAASITVAAALASAATPPPAKGMKTSITAPTTVTAATIHISKSSQAQISVGTGVVTFKLKIKGVLDNAGNMPVNSTGNTATFTFLVNGMTRNKDFGFDLVDGKGAFKNPIADGDAATWGTMLAAGATIELRQVRLTEVGTGELFGVSGITLK